ncbi:nitrate- and nitrite sensing domain-containing protein [Streptomyces hoynatensis]|uniref:histidine kinase n=1 Tax=Streptomyces hoynatensis TaxID=1141874 RepID=A0A3A9Z975_9ACTN|nr:nitrate- and nitrite sensing domain-containing protein [Streptomyces hoynatensis]RKN44798.1 HAMP domain-containing protein [Streptomyces hoynatensis]
MRFRGKSIRRKMGALVLVPLLSLVSLWAYAAATTISQARAAGAAVSAVDTLDPPLGEVVLALQQERRQTLVYLADPRRAEASSELQRMREATDTAVAALSAAGDEARGGLHDAAADRLDALLTALGSLGQLREQVESNTIVRTGALDAYGGLVAPALRLFAVLQPEADPDLDPRGRAVAGLRQAREYLSQEDALVAGLLAAGRTEEGELDALNDRVLRRELTYDASLPDLLLDDRQAHETFWEGGTGRIVGSLEQDLLAGHTAAVRADQWAEASSTALDELGRLTGTAYAGYRGAFDGRVSAANTRAAVVTGLGLAGLLLSALLALRLGRGLVRDLRALSRQAQDAAEVRLPGVTRRLAAGEHVDVETEAPRLEYGQDEIGRVGQALNTLQREAVSAAVARARTHRGMSEVFVNLARRSQVLLHRQLSLLEGLKRRAGEPADLEDLIRADHLATRMRRHADSLVILSGTAPARQWRRPERLMDVVRAAVDEVEDFQRIEVRRMPPLAVAGGAVADLVHLVAELLENATVFSPPHTAVQVSGERVPHGFTLEIHDRGLGMTADALREANLRLAEVAEFEPSESDRVGLYVVSRLAQRHGLRVSLRESPYGGTTAVTLIPGELLTEAEEEPPGRLPGGQRPVLLDGPVDGPVELEAPVGAGAPGQDTGAREHEREPERPGAHAVRGAPESAPPPGQPRRRTAPVLVADHGRPVGRPPEPGGPTPDEQSTPPTTPTAPTSPTTPVTPAVPTTATGLPRRVRRAAPGTPRGRDRQDGPGAGAERPVSHPEPPPEQDAEEVRARMASLQRGWQLGRRQTDPPRGGMPPQ